MQGMQIELNGDHIEHHERGQDYISDALLLSLVQAGELGFERVLHTDIDLVEEMKASTTVKINM